jgi:hypothetical protein
MVGFVPLELLRNWWNRRFVAAREGSASWSVHLRAFLLPKGTGEAWIRPSVADLSSILSVENRAGAASHHRLQKRLRQDIAFQRGNPRLASARMMLGTETNRSLHARNGANIPASPHGLGDLERMEHGKLANGTGHKPVGHSPAPALRDQMDVKRSAGEKTARKKAAPKKAESARPLLKEMGSKAKSDQLVCRYCGSDDLAPSFIKRRDRRCRKCFSKRYGSAAGTRKAKVKK